MSFQCPPPYPLLVDLNELEQVMIELDDAHRLVNELRRSIAFILKHGTEYYGIDRKK